jgi:hypothetical protein
VGAVPASGVTALAAGCWQGEPALLAARGAALLRFDLASRAWTALGDLPAPIREILPALDDSPRALILTGTGADQVPRDGALWWAKWPGKFTCPRVAGVQGAFRPWQLWWTRAAGERRLAVATYKATPAMQFEHNCMFVFAWQDGEVDPRWLGSRLSRPYIDATHADLRGDGNWRMVAVEVTRDGKRGLGVYRPIGFGYEGEWRTQAVAGLQRVVACGDVAVCWGRDAAGKPLAWQLLPVGEAYRLAPLNPAPPAPQALVRLDAAHLAGWWDGGWHVIRLRGGR